MTAVAFTINGKAMSVETEPDTALLWVRAARSGLCDCQKVGDRVPHIADEVRLCSRDVRCAPIAQLAVETPEAPWVKPESF